MAANDSCYMHEIGRHIYIAKKIESGYSLTWSQHTCNTAFTGAESILDTEICSTSSTSAWSSPDMPSTCQPFKVHFGMLRAGNRVQPQWITQYWCGVPGCTGGCFRCRRCLVLARLQTLAVTRDSPPAPRPLGHSIPASRVKHSIDGQILEKDQQRTTSYWTSIDWFKRHNQD